MARRKAVKPTESASDLMMRTLDKVDPEIVAAGLLGAIAASGGLTPPLTRLLETMNTSAATDYMHIFAVTGPGFIFTSTQALVGALIGNGNDSDSDKEKTVKLRALMASGMMEGMIMMAFVKNKDAMKTAAGLAESAITAAGNALPF